MWPNSESVLLHGDTHSLARGITQSSLKEVPSAFIGRISTDQWEPQRHQILEADQSTVKALKIELLLEPMYTTVAQDLCAKVK